MLDIYNKTQSILEYITVDDPKIEQIEQLTQDQSKSSMWLKERIPRITASQCKRALIRETTSPTKAMRDILGYNKHFESKYMRDGIDSESETLSMTGNKVQKCGLFVSKTHPFLGASPDGLLGKKGVIEVKRVHPYEAENLEQALLRQHIIKDIDGSQPLNPNHQYYYQVQMQMFCTGRTWAHFVASDGKNIIIKTVLHDKEFIDAILSKLKNFYYDILLLELAYPRVKHGIDRIGKLGISYSMLSNLRNN